MIPQGRLPLAALLLCAALAVLAVILRVRVRWEEPAPCREDEAYAAGRLAGFEEGLDAEQHAAERRAHCNCPESGTSGSCPFHDAFTTAPRSMTSRADNAWDEGMFV